MNRLFIKNSISLLFILFITLSLSGCGGGGSSNTNGTVIPSIPLPTGGAIVVYEFDDASGNTVTDTSDSGTPLNLTIEDTSKTTWLNGGLSVGQATSIFSTGVATKIIDAIKTSNEITIEAWIVPDNVTQTGPARIVTLSKDSSSRNFTLGQEGRAYDVRLRNTATSVNGRPSLSGEDGSATAGELTHVVYTRNSSGENRLYINSSADVSVIEEGDMSNWDDTYRFGLANEVGTARPWLGDYYRVAVYDRALSAEEVSINFASRPDVNSAPTANNVSITDDGGVFIGETLIANYNYNDVDGDIEGTSLYRWLRDGVVISNANTLNYTLVAADAGKQIQFELTPVAQSGARTGLAILSNTVTVELGNSPPTAIDVNITDDNAGQAEIGDTLIGSYVYQDSDIEGASIFRWLRDGDEITGANNIEYVLVAADDGKLIQFEVTPVATTGTLIGLAVLSDAIAVNIPLSIISHFPSADDTDISRATAISIVFNLSLDAISVNATSLSLSDDNGIVDTEITQVNNTITLSPIALLGEFTSYTVTLEAGIKDIFGSALTETYSWSFTTGNSVVTLPVNYGIIYVSYPLRSIDDSYVPIPRGEHPYDIRGGADLMYLKMDGSEDILYDCDSSCSVMDPVVSYDAKTVYFHIVEDIVDGDKTNIRSSWLYKIHLKQDGASYTNSDAIQLTFDDGFDSLLYAGNTTAVDSQANVRGIRDMSPWPLADGRILFMSNRAGLQAFRSSGARAYIVDSIQQLYVMDDHEGGAVTKELSNLHRLETGSIHQTQHAIQLKDGRILFSMWHDTGPKYGYAMTNLMTIHPDGSNLQQFTEPHEHTKRVEHFVTQLSDEHIISDIYYPGNNYGHGILMRYPLDPPGQDFLRGHSQEKDLSGNFMSEREFDRKDSVVLTPHTSWRDSPAPDLSGKYAMQSAGPNNELLVSYNKGSSNTHAATCQPDKCGHLDTGIYLIRNADTIIVDEPVEPKLIMVRDEPGVNEIWPRAVINYEAIYGQPTPDLLNNIHTTGHEDDRLDEGEAASLVGTSSMYNREPNDGVDPDPFNKNDKREIHDGNWTIQGAEAGVFSPAEIHGVRIIATPPIPYTRNYDNHSEIERYFERNDYVEVNRRFRAEHKERWEIMGEFPLVHKATLDEQGNPDSSWVAKIPSEVPFLIQALDWRGMTLFSELTWRALKSGEDRTDCGGCHAHSEEVTPLPIENTQAGDVIRAPITNVAFTDVNGNAVASDDQNITDRIKEGMWDLTTGSIPLYSGPLNTDPLNPEIKVTFTPGGTYGVEFNTHIKGIIDTKCVTCHTANGVAGDKLILDGTDLSDAFGILTRDAGFNFPQISRYIRLPQARQSLLVWAVYNERLDGRDNTTRDFDIDYVSGSHDDQDYIDAGLAPLTDAEKRLFAHWVDLGLPINYPQTDGFGYTEDYLLPVVNLYRPKNGLTTDNLIVGFNDAHSGLDKNSVLASYYSVADGVNSSQNISIDQVNISDKNILSMPLPSAIISAPGEEFVVDVSIEDNVGNKNTTSVRFTVQ